MPTGTRSLRGMSEAASGIVERSRGLEPKCLLGAKLTAREHKH